MQAYINVTPLLGNKFNLYFPLLVVLMFGLSAFDATGR